MKLEEIVRELDLKKETLVVEENIVYIINSDTLKFLKIFRRSNGKWIEFDLEDKFQDMATYITDRLQKTDFIELIKEFLKARTPIEDVIEIQERIERGASIKTAPERCFSIMIGGKVGRPFELCLINNEGVDT